MFLVFVRFIHLNSLGLLQWQCGYHIDIPVPVKSWWRHQMETFSALLAFCAGNSPVTGEFPAQRSVTRSFDIFFDLHLNRQLNKQWRRWWIETLPRSLWRHCNVIHVKDMGKMDQRPNKAKHNKTRTECIILWMYCMKQKGGKGKRLFMITS